MKGIKRIYYYGLQGVAVLLLCGAMWAGAKLFESHHGARALHPDDSTECKHHDIAGPCRSIETIGEIRADHDKHVSDRSILWIEKGYLSREESLDLHRRIDKGIGDVERALGIEFPADVYRKSRIEFFVHGGRGPSHTLSGNRPGRFLHPVVLLTEAKEKRAPFIREIVHVIAWDWHTLWLREGLAILLNDRFGGYGAYPNFGEPLDDMVREFAATELLSAQSALELLGRNGMRDVPPRAVRKIFYLFSASFVAHLEREIGLPALMRVYSEPDATAALLRLTGRTMAYWKLDWRARLRRGGYGRS